MKSGRPSKAEELGLTQEDVVAAYEREGTLKAAAKALGISYRTIKTYMKRVPKASEARRRRTEQQKERMRLTYAIRKKPYFRDVRGRRIPTPAVERIWVVVSEPGSRVLARMELRTGQTVYAVFRYPQESGISPPEQTPAGETPEAEPAHRSPESTSSASSPYTPPPGRSDRGRLQIPV